MEAKDRGKVRQSSMRATGSFSNVVQVQVHVCRAYGSILEKSQGLQGARVEQAEQMLLVLKNELKPQLNYKVQWNAATAIGRAYTNTYVYEMCSSITEEVVKGLAECESKSRNMKVR